MRESVRLGHVAGFPVAVDWSVTVILVMLAWALAEGALPASAPGLTTAAYWLGGWCGALLLLGSLLAHELAHAVVARHSGVRVEKLTLWVFGGIATFQDEAPTPRSELRIAAAGPATSLLLGTAFGLLWTVLGPLGHLHLLAAVAAWLAVTNVVLGVFNLVPGAPLDGGRVLRAVLWARHGDRDRAATTAAFAGQVVGMSLVVLGLLDVGAGNLIGGLWLALIGWFVVSAARAEEQTTMAHKLTEGLSVADVMSTPVLTARSWMTVDEFIGQRVLQGRHSSYAVVDDGAVLGLVTLAQVRTVPPARRHSTPLHAVMIPLSDVATASPDDALDTLLPRLTPRSGRRALVIDDGALVGIVTWADLSRVLAVRSLLTEPSGSP
jgi:Zn-dependent protease/predicted transcriptional regulator